MKKETLYYLDKLHGGDWSTHEKRIALYNLVVQCSREFAGRELLSVEVGVFAGVSLFSIANAHKDLNNGAAYGIDSWDNVTPLEGSNAAANNEWWKNLPIEGIYRAFLDSCQRQEWSGHVNHYKGKSYELADKFANESITLFHQDGNHNKETIIREIELYAPKLVMGGYWVIDDADWPETQEGYAALPSYGFELVEDHVKWQIWKKMKQPKMDAPKVIIEDNKVEVVGNGMLGIEIIGEAYSKNANTEKLFGVVQPILLYLPDTDQWQKRFLGGLKHFYKNQIKPFCVAGVHAKSWGITSNRVYMRDTWGRLIHKYGNTLPTAMPEELKNPYYMGDGKVGGLISHYILYNVMLAMDSEYFLVMEDDCRFKDGWYSKLEQAMEDAPSDFHVLFVGSSDAENKEPVHVKGDVWHFPHRDGKEDYYPQTGFCYIIAKKALPLLIATQRDTSEPVDVQLIYKAFPYLNVYAILPRLADQEKTPLNP